MYNSAPKCGSILVKCILWLVLANLKLSWGGGSSCWGRVRNNCLLFMYMYKTSILVSSTAVAAQHRWYWVFHFSRVTFACTVFRVHLTRLIDQSVGHCPQVIAPRYHNIGQFTALCCHSHLRRNVILIRRMNMSRRENAKPLNNWKTINYASKFVSDCTITCCRCRKTTTGRRGVFCIDQIKWITSAKTTMALWLWLHCAWTSYCIAGYRSHISKILGTHAMYFGFRVVTANTRWTLLWIDRAPEYLKSIFMLINQFICPHLWNNSLCTKKKYRYPIEPSLCTYLLFDRTNELNR